MSTTGYSKMPVSSFKSKYKLINAPGKYELTVQHVSQEKFTNPNIPGQQYNIVTFRAVLGSNVTEALKADIAAGSIDVANIKALSFNVPDTFTLPAKDEIVNVTVGFVHSKRQGKDVLAVTTFSVPAAQKVSASNWDTILGEESTTPVVVGTSDDENDGDF
jgi:hypothetical protein